MEYNYNKKSIWKWILLYLIIGTLAYGLIYYFFFYKNGGYNYDSQNYQNNSQNQIQSNSETADWKTYKNDEYGWEIQYPGTWKVQDGSYVYNGEKSINLNVVGPIRYDLPNYELGVEYLAQISIAKDGKVISQQGFIKVHESGQQAVEEIDLPKNILENYREYTDVQKIISTFKFTK